MKYAMIMFIISLFLSPAGLKAQDSEFKDTPYFSGMPYYTIYDASDLEFDSYKFFNGKICTTVEGKKFKRTYTLKEDGSKSSVLQISRNYANAIKSMGGTVIFEGAPQNAECADNNGLQMVVGKVMKDNNEMWVEVVPSGDGSDYYLTIIVKEIMKQDVTASDMLNTLNKEGKIALYINFDVNKATIKPESKSIVDQIAIMMNEDSTLNISIEGHTDNTGEAKKNKTLSENRALAVKEAIIKQGVDTKRLYTFGWGQDKPIADNKTEEGKARNRRVELVKK